MIVEFILITIAKYVEALLWAKHQANDEENKSWQTFKEIFSPMD
jgi:hypothetical protein